MTVEFVNTCDVRLVGALASDNDVAMAAWVSHDIDNEERLQHPDRVKRLINFLYANKHLSPFEHGIFKFKVDVPLFVAREFHRHRTFSYNEVSGRYTQMKPRFWKGSVARVQHGKPGNYHFEDGTREQTAIYIREKETACSNAWDSYQRRLDAGIAKEQAREDLPLSLMTQFYATCNPRNLMQFLTLRNEAHALKEIQGVAVEMEKIFALQMPFTYQAYVTARDRWSHYENWLEAYNNGTDMPSGYVNGSTSGTNPNYQFEIHLDEDINPAEAAAAVQRSFDRRERRNHGPA